MIDKYLNGCVIVAEFCVRISFSGLVIGFVFPEKTDIPEEFFPLLYSGEAENDEEFRIVLLDTPLKADEDSLVFESSDMKVYKNTDCQLRVYTSFAGDDGCYFGCLLRKNGKNEIYYPLSEWKFYSSPFRPLHLIAGEVLLLKYNAFLLHSSVVMYKNKAVLFCGASGAGKSTQAELWKKYLGADIINGDRCVVMKKDGSFLGGGSPWCGTSGIRRSDIFPIGGIFIPEKSDRNFAEPVKSAAFGRLFSQITVNLWDKNFVNSVSQMLAELIESVPIYNLYCRPDEDAAIKAAEVLFGKEI